MRALVLRTRSLLARLRRSRALDVRGSITPFALIVSIALLALGGLVVDGGRQLNAKGRAVAYAQEAARAGAQAIDLTRTRTQIVPELARQIAQDYCSKAMAADTQLVSCVPTLVTIPGAATGDTAPGAQITISVTAEISTRPIMLGMFGRGDMRSSGEALARPVAGISEADQDQLPSVGPPSVQAPGDGGFTTIPPGEPPPGQASVPCTPSPTPSPTKPPKDDETTPPTTTPPTTTPPTGPTVPPGAFCTDTPTTPTPEPPGGDG